MRKKTKRPSRSKIMTWDYEQFELLQVTLTNKFQAVYALPCDEDDDDGYHYLEAMDIDGIALVRVTIETYEGDPDKPETVKHWREAGSENMIVGIVLDVTGEWHVCKEDENFAGLCRRGADCSRVTHDLAYRYHDKLRPKPKTKLPPLEMLN